MEASDNDKLRRKLIETEARVTARLIVSAQQVLPPEHLAALMKQFEDNASLDMLEIERQIADLANEKSHILEDLYSAVKNYKECTEDFQKEEERKAMQIGLEPPQWEAYHEMQERVKMYRLKMFSLFEEISLRGISIP